MIHSHLIAQTFPLSLDENIVAWEKIRVTVLSETLFRIEQDDEKAFCNEATQSVWYRNTPKVDYSAEIQDCCLTVTTGKAILCVKNDVYSSTVTIDGKTVKLSEIENLPGAYRSLDCCNGDVYITKENTYKIKLEDGIVSRSGVGIHDDSESLVLGTDGRLYKRNNKEIDLYIFAHGKDYRQALKDLFTICGKCPLIPKYAFGNWWSRYYPYSEGSYMHLLDSLEERNVPLTVAVIDMDWHWSDTLDQKKKISVSGKKDAFHGCDCFNPGWTGYSWNTDLFPDPKRFLNKIKDRNLKITLNLHPADGIRFFEDMYPEMANAMGVDPSTEEAIPFDFTSDKFINAYFDILHRPYEKDGVDFWWIDWQHGTQTAMPGLDPLWALNHYHTLDIAQSKQPLILSRYCGIGSNRYPLGFSGDTHITWESLDYIPYFTAMGTNAGYTWWSHDIGGHTEGYKDDELYTRYVQFGVFSPINRLHCTSCEISTKEPSVYMNGKGLVAEEFLRLRHRMIPFLYSASYDTHNEGKALIEPMYYAYPDNEEAYSCPGQYLFGGQMIVAPITEKSSGEGLAKKNVWLPEGKWTDIFTGDEYDGGKWTDMIRWLDTIPVLAKSGTVFVLDGRRNTNSLENSDNLEVMVFNGNGSYTLHEDKDKKIMHTHFVSSEEYGKQMLRVSFDGDINIMNERKFRLKFKNIRAGNVTVTASNNSPVNFETLDVGECLEIILTANSDTQYTVQVEYTDNRREYRDNRFIYNLLRLEGPIYPKNDFRLELIKCDDNKAKRLIDETTLLGEMQKMRLKEAW